MKKIMVLVTAVFLALFCTACFSFDAGDEELHLSYNEDDIRANLKRIADDGGLYIAMTVAEEKTNDDGETEIDPENSYALYYGANGDLYYYMDKQNEYFYDLTSESSYVVYLRAIGQEEWEVQNNPYSDTADKNTALSELNEVTSDLFKHLCEGTQFEGEKMKRSTGTVLERDCDDYYVSMKFFGIGISYNVYVDKATGACLKETCDTSLNNEDTTIVSFQCTVFSESYTVTLPQIQPTEK